MYDDGWRVVVSPKELRHFLSYRSLGWLQAAGMGPEA
jgi:hypothetical protein